MPKRLLAITVLLPIAVCFSFFKTSKAVTNNAQKSTDCCIDTFKLKYQISLGGGKIKSVDNNFYVGMLNDTYLIKNKTYRQLVFGDSVRNVIAFVRQDEEKLSYVVVSDNDTTVENPMFYFNKNVNDHWNINIEGSYFWEKEIKFLKTENLGNDTAYVYTLQTERGYTTNTNAVIRVYYSKKKGFLKFYFKTHWAIVEAKKTK